MLYQLAIYTLSQDFGRVAVILYPTINQKAEEERIKIRNTIRGRGCAQVILRHVNLAYLDSLLSSPDSMRIKRENYAMQLAFGG